MTKKRKRSIRSIALFLSSTGNVMCHVIRTNKKSKMYQPGSIAQKTVASMVRTALKEDKVTVAPFVLRGCVGWRAKPKNRR